MCLLSPVRERSWVEPGLERQARLPRATHAAAAAVTQAQVPPQVDVFSVDLRSLLSDFDSVYFSCLPQKVAVQPSEDLSKAIVPFSSCDTRVKTSFVNSVYAANIVAESVAAAVNPSLLQLSFEHPLSPIRNGRSGILCSKDLNTSLLIPVKHPTVIVFSIKDSTSNAPTSLSSFHIAMPVEGIASFVHHASSPQCDCDVPSRLKDSE
ncbi:hypothetical protein KSP40_PGU013726 [Platanthera guangdongensis]|uniref:Uncharacterized protein n=1 Tax=Platanthera guangdongensis TaxID=2320717 RepID=A0ABR2LHK0_9ASPA